MDQQTILLALAALISWGVGSFFAKIAADKIGTKSVFFDLLGYIPAIFLYVFTVFRARELLSADKVGALLAFIAGAIGSGGMIAFYYLLSRENASLIVPLTSLYPALTIVLALIILKEPLTTTKFAGIVFSLIAIYLLSK